MSWQACPVCKGTGIDIKCGTMGESTKECRVCRGRFVISESTGLPPAKKEEPWQHAAITIRQSSMAEAEKNRCDDCGAPGAHFCPGRSTILSYGRRAKPCAHCSQATFGNDLCAICEARSASRA